MGSWDSIYQNYQKGGDAWATLSEGIDQRFVELLKNYSFTKKKVLDIGCGTGKYLSFLEKRGFVTDGIDSSPTAIEMTKEILSKSATIQLADMYSFAYPENTYDLVISISTLHHGRKTQIKNTIAQIYSSLVPEGKILITLPMLDTKSTGESFKNHSELEPGTFIPNSGPEEGIPHSFFSEDEVRDLFSSFRNLSLESDEIGRWFITGTK